MSTPLAGVTVLQENQRSFASECECVCVGEWVAGGKWKHVSGRGIDPPRSFSF